MSDTGPRPLGPSLDQRRALHGARAVDQFRSSGPPTDRLRLYPAYVDRLGPTILVNGLGQALAMELASAGSTSDDPHRRLADTLGAWLCDPRDGVLDRSLPAGTRPGMAALTRLCEADQRTYVRAQAEALAWLSWHTRFVRAATGADDEPVAD
jgi:CRISPR-associated protein Cmr5